MVEVATTSILIFNLKASLIEWGDLNLNLSKAFTRRFTMNKYGAWTNDRFKAKVYCSLEED